MTGSKFFYLICAALCVALFVSCGGKRSTAATTLPELGDRYALDPDVPAWRLDTAEKVTLTWYVNQAWWNTTFNEDIVTRQFARDLNVNIEFTAGDDTRLNTIAAGGDFPDLVTLGGQNHPLATRADAWAWPLDELADKYDPYFRKVIRNDTYNWYQLDNGKTYGYPNYSNSAEDYESGNIPSPTAFVMRQDVYDAIGRPDLSSPQAFIQAMRDIKRLFPDLIPFGAPSFGDGLSSLGEYLQNMIGVPVLDEKGEYYDRYFDEDYIRWIKALRQVRQDGNIIDDMFADDGDTFADKIRTGRYASILTNSVIHLGSALQDFATYFPHAEYIPIEAMASTMGRPRRLGQAGLSGWLSTYISRNSRDPAKAIQIYTYLLSDEGGILTFYGIEGETFIWNQAGRIEFMPWVNELLLINPRSYQTDLRLREFILFGHDRFATLSDQIGWETNRKVFEWGRGKLVPAFEIENIRPPLGTPEARALSAVEASMNTAFVAMIRADSDEQVDNLLSGYRSFQNENMWDSIVRFYNERIARNKQRLGN